MRVEIGLFNGDHHLERKGDIMRVDTFSLHGEHHERNGDIMRVEIGLFSGDHHF